MGIRHGRHGRGQVFLLVLQAVFCVLQVALGLEVVLGLVEVGLDGCGVVAERVDTGCPAQRERDRNNDGDRSRTALDHAWLLMEKALASRGAYPFFSCSGPL